MTKLFKIIILTLIVQHFGVTVQAQDKSAEIDKIFSWATKETPGCVCAIAQNGKVIYNRAQGLADLERNVLLSPDSKLDAGSLVKQFVAASTLLLVEDGKLSLSDDIRKYIPELPEYGAKITIDQLLTHTSGIRDWTGLQMFSNGSEDSFKMMLRQRGLNFKPGEEWAYSNSNYVLLKELIARLTGMNFSEFSTKRLFEPLGMNATRYVDDLRSVVKNRALAYEKQQGAWTMAMYLDNDRGGGALLSTATDLLIWNAALNDKKLGDAVSQKLEEPAKLNNGRQLTYARGLFNETYFGNKEVWHTGAASGYKSWLGRFPTLGLSISIMCNAGDESNGTRYAERIVELLNGPIAKGPDPTLLTDTAGLDLTEKTGVYMNEKTGDLLRLAIEGKRFRVVGGPALSPLKTNSFARVGKIVSFMSGDEFKLNFIGKDQVELTTMEGKVVRYQRLQTYTPSAEEMKSFSGKFESKDLAATFEVRPEKGILMLRLTHLLNQSLEFRPIGLNRFQRGMMIIHFTR
ncbi:MAG: class A beta-lactamase-related serine hydrolase, partial [Chitinophagaceae bacterium]